MGTQATYTKTAHASAFLASSCSSRRSRSRALRRLRSHPLVFRCSSLSPCEITCQWERGRFLRANTPFYPTRSPFTYIIFETRCRWSPATFSMIILSNNLTCLSWEEGQILAQDAPRGAPSATPRDPDPDADLAGLGRLCMPLRLLLHPCDRHFGSPSGRHDRDIIYTGTCSSP